MKTIIERRFRRKLRIKKRLAQTTTLPQVIVFRSNKHTYAQLYDPKSKRVITGVVSKSINQGSGEKLTKTQLAFEIGKHLGKLIREKGISRIVFNRNGFKFHGRVKAVCEGLREAGIVV